MKRIMVLALCLCALYANPFNANAAESGQTLFRAGTRSLITGAEKTFTGSVRIEPLFTETSATPFGGAYLTFEPGARTFWHSHPYGQHLVVTSGVGRTGYRNGTVEEIGTGDVIWCPPGVAHWHGASPDAAMTHLAITGIRDGINHDWMEAVTDEQYHGK